MRVTLCCWFSGCYDIRIYAQLGKFKINKQLHIQEHLRAPKAVLYLNSSFLYFIDFIH